MCSAHSSVLIVTVKGSDSCLCMNGKLDYNSFLFPVVRVSDPFYKDRQGASLRTNKPCLTLSNLFTLGSFNCEWSTKERNGSYLTTQLRWSMSSKIKEFKAQQLTQNKSQVSQISTWILFYTEKQCKWSIGGISHS